MYPRFTLVLGGAASGKSDFAEAFAVRNGKARVYLATAQALDGEMRRKIDEHIARRGDGWTTVEAPDDLSHPLAALTSGQVCLLDCATMWLSNRMLSGDGDTGTARSVLLRDLSRCAADLVVVSNETGQGIVPDTALARRFREAQGRLNIALAAQADLVIQVIAGLPQVLKGQMP
ncbi:bifunctional adenosylcobinamide kinase/adenosylcobinamide-phosphate guanylyltransferase [Sedimentitalea sp. JM2-8]|uniref:Bifunctional adenosylcobalamin biosynthesis protein n=1 Tax=Sedimentitalea xiamensis TaxID=3050037 RepID=A0ABT7FAP3_9RHOB|nr:bifunctional adenosylcobinamide kinase/adenosylcobinamide-phosphate guanylyltransferase [Sedimentitalea xiamensis]MDK3072177.1 bifunctional adenosylcobinamide kinase/adenosylcobinamide-phosphate guanylyltransferase [Sedimentitalea xiamensis]